MQTLSCFKNYRHSRFALSDEIIALADLARALESPSTPWLRLARNARQETLRGVRARNLELLTRHFSGREESRAAARAASPCGSSPPTKN